MSKTPAEKMNYWDTTVHPAKSQAEILELLEDFGVVNCQISQGQAAGRFAWLIRFEWQGRTYHFIFIPLECQFPEKESSFGGKRRIHQEQAKYQMGRIAVYFVKAILTAAETNPDALFGFLELPAIATHPGGIPATAANLDVSGLTRALPELPINNGDIYLLSDNNE